MKQVAVFVDAGYFWVQASKTLYFEQRPRDLVKVDYPGMRSAMLEQIETHSPRCDLLRIYWYDGPGSTGAKTSEHERIARLDDFKLRLGARNIRGDQKAVDGLLIADLIGLAQNKAINEAIIVSGDADLIPGVLAVQSLGIRVLLLEIGDQDATSPYLIAEVDRYCNWPSESVLSFSRKTTIPCPQKHESPPPASASHPDLAKIITEFFDAQSPETRLLLAALDQNQPIPSAIDRALLEMARTENQNKWLEKDQTKHIRFLLKKHAKQQPSR